MGVGASTSSPIDVNSAVAALLTAPEDAAWTAARDRLLPSELHVPAPALFAALHPSHLRELAAAHPRALALLLDYAVGLMVTAARGTGGAAAHVAALNAARLLTRALPPLLSGGEGGAGFVARLFWEDLLPAGGGAAGDAWVAREEAAGEAVARGAAVAFDAPFDGPPAPGEATPQPPPHPRAPLGVALVNATLSLLFCPGLTVHPMAWEAYEARVAARPRDEGAGGGGGGGDAAAQAPAAVAAAAADTAPPPPPPLTPPADDPAPAPANTTANTVWPSLLWAGGAAFPNLRLPPAREEWLRARAELLRLLIVLLSAPLFALPHTAVAGPPRSPFSDALTLGAAPWAPTLFFSLLNTACGHDAGGGLGAAVPYAGTLLGGGGAAEALTPLCFQALLLLLVYAPHALAAPQKEGDPLPLSQFNIFRHMLATLSAPADLRFVWGGVCRLLQASAPPATALPGAAYRALPFQADVALFAWALVEGCPAAPHYLHGAGGGGAGMALLPELAAPLLHLALCNRQSAVRAPLVQLAVLLLLRLSAGRAFGVALNARLGARGVAALPVELPPLDGEDGGAHVDVLLLVVHKLVVDGGPAHTQLLPLLLTLVQNVAPFAKGLSMAASARLLGLLEVFSSPRYLFAGEKHWTVTAQVLGILNSILRYQFESNAALVYSLLRRRELLERLATLTLAGFREGEAVARAAAATAGASGAAGTGLEPLAGLGAAPPAADAAALPPRPPHRPRARTPAPAASAALTDAWWEAARVTLPLQPLLHMVAYLAPRVEEAGKEGADEETLLALLRRETMAGVLPPPEPIVCVNQLCLVKLCLFFEPH